VSITVQPQKVTIGDHEYLAEVGRIGFTILGKEDHGIFTFMLDMSFGGSGQGAGMYCLNDPEQFGKAVQGVLNFFGGTWEEITGRSVFSLRKGENGPILGLMHLDYSRAIIFGDWEVVK
jgi:hypothetical protein